MNQKDYKAISEIIKTSLEIPLREMLANRLADYFEREDKEQIAIHKYSKDGKIRDRVSNATRVFNRKQFLRDCGVN